MTDERDRDDQGRFKERISNDEILEVVERVQPAGTAEIADELGVRRQSADYRLRQLVETGTVTKTKIGNSLVWSVPE